MNVAAKQWGGMAAYYGEALRLFLTHRFQRFEVEWSDPPRCSPPNARHARSWPCACASSEASCAGSRPTLRWRVTSFSSFSSAPRTACPIACTYCARFCNSAGSTPGVDLVCARDAVCRPIPGEPSEQHLRRGRRRAARRLAGALQHCSQSADSARAEEMTSTTETQRH